MNLFDEFISELYGSKAKCEILSKEEKEKIAKCFFEKYLLTSYGRIDWSKVKNKVLIDKPENIFVNLEANKQNIDSPIYLIWGDASLPLVKCNIEDVLRNYDMALFLGGTATWIYNPNEEWVVELYHDGDITLGFHSAIDS